MARPPTLVHGSKIRALRRSKGLTQEDLADKVDLPVKTISRAERGRTSLDTLDRIAGYFGEDISIFLVASDHQQEEPASRLVRTAFALDPNSKLEDKGKFIGLVMAMVSEYQILGSGNEVTLLLSEDDARKLRYLLRQGALREYGVLDQAHRIIPPPPACYELDLPFNIDDFCQKLQRLDSDAWKTFADSVTPFIRCRAYDDGCASIGDDIVQNALTKIYLRIKEGWPAPPFERTLEGITGLVRVFYLATYKEIVKKKRPTLIPSEQAAEVLDGTPETEPIPAVDVYLMWKLFANVVDEKRVSDLQLLQLRYLEGRSIAEIALHVQMPQDQVNRKLHKCKEELRLRLSCMNVFDAASLQELLTDLQEQSFFS